MMEQSILFLTVEEKSNFYFKNVFSLVKEFKNKTIKQITHLEWDGVCIYYAA